MDYWVQGVPTRRAQHGLAWQEVLYCRLTTEHIYLEQGMKTAEAEDGLRIRESCAYFFLARCDPAFSEHAIIFDHNNAAVGKLAPFDTGGFWFNHIVTMPRTPAASKWRYVEKYSQDAAGPYFAEFCKWGRRAFDTESEYVLASRPPKVLYAREIDLDASDFDSRSWTWEGRIPKRDTHATLIPRRLFLQPHRYAQYVTWVRNRTSLLPDQAIEHLRLVATLVQDAGSISSGDAANQWIILNGTWQ